MLVYLMVCGWHCVPEASRCPALSHCQVDKTHLLPQGAVCEAIIRLTARAEKAGGVRLAHAYSLQDEQENNPRETRTRLLSVSRGWQSDSLRNCL